MLSPKYAMNLCVWALKWNVRTFVYCHFVRSLVRSMNRDNKTELNYNTRDQSIRIADSMKTSMSYLAIEYFVGC